jgi:hypothetical protein
MACWTIAEPGNTEQMLELTAALDAQRDIPGVVSAEHGPRTARVDWDGPDKAFDYAMVVTFDSLDAARAYPAHPIHQKLVGTIFWVGSDVREFWLDMSTPEQALSDGNSAMAALASDRGHALTVFWKLDLPEKAEARRDLVAAVEAQRVIPGVLSVQHGPRMLQADWDAPDKTFDYGMLLLFDSFDSARAYVPHPVHQALVATILRLGSDVSDIRGFWFDQ